MAIPKRRSCAVPLGYAAAMGVAYCYRHPERETRLSCSECERSVCTECAVFIEVGIRCPEHSGQPQGVAKVTSELRKAGTSGEGALATKALIIANVAVFAIAVLLGAPAGGFGGSLARGGALFAGDATIGVAAGEWWRLLTAGFLHAGLIHLGFNMLILWWFGAPLEQTLGRGRYASLYFASLLSGSAGALLFAPQTPTVGASGAVFGVLGAMLVLERQAGATRGPVAGIIALNLILSVAIPGISLGGHLGGLVGGILSMLALARLSRRGSRAELGLVGVLTVALGSVLIAWLQVQAVA